MFDFWSGWITHLETMVVEEEGIFVKFLFIFFLSFNGNESMLGCDGSEVVQGLL